MPCSTLWALKALVCQLQRDATAYGAQKNRELAEWPGEYFELSLVKVSLHRSPPLADGQSLRIFIVPRCLEVRQERGWQFWAYTLKELINSDYLHSRVGGPVYRMTVRAELISSFHRRRAGLPHRNE